MYIKHPLHIDPTLQEQSMFHGISSGHIHSCYQKKKSKKKKKKKKKKKNKKKTLNSISWLIKSLERNLHTCVKPQGALHFLHL
jgi:hypothetical protein